MNQNKDMNTEKWEMEKVWDKKKAGQHFLIHFYKEYILIWSMFSFKPYKSAGPDEVWKNAGLQAQGSKLLRIELA